MSNWTEVTLKDISTISGEYGIGASATDYSPDKPRYLRITDIDDNGRLNFTDIKGFEGEDYSQYILHENDIVFARTGNTTGKNYIYNSTDGELVFAGFLVRFRINPLIANPRFVKYCVNTKQYWDWVKINSQRSGQPGINGKEYGKYSFSIPPLKEQQKIAEILSSVDEAIEKTEQVIAKTEEVKKGLMQQLLTKGIGHTEFKQTEIGEIPIDWTVKKLVDITLPKQGIKRGPFGGALKKEIFVEQGYAVYEQQHVINNNMEDFRYFINEDKYLELKSFEVLPNDVLISCSGTVGKVVLVPKNNITGVINQALLRLRFNDSINPVYALILFTSDLLQKQLIEMSHGSTLKNIVGVPLLKEITIPIPTLKEQQEIISIFTHIEDKLDNEKNKHDVLVRTKKGLMQQLLTGQVRVKVD